MLQRASYKKIFFFSKLGNILESSSCCYKSQSQCWNEILLRGFEMPLKYPNT